MKSDVLTMDRVGDATREHPIAAMSCQGEEIMCLLDTGSAWSIVNPGLRTDSFLRKCEKKESCQLVLECFKGQTRADSG